MAIYGIGCTFESNGTDLSVCSDFLRESVIGTDWPFAIALDVHNFFRSLKAGDIVYLKKAAPGTDIKVLAIGVVADAAVWWEDSHGNPCPASSALAPIALLMGAKLLRRVKWLLPKTGEDKVNRKGLLPLLNIANPAGKNNVRYNTIYEEFSLDVWVRIIGAL